jgi:hypothetical protein
LRTRLTGLTGLAAAGLAIGAFAAPSAAGHVQGSFAPTGDMTTGRSDAVAAPLPDGRVLVAGGFDPTQLDVPSFLNSAEIFDPATGTFSPTGSMTVPRYGAAAAPLPDGRVLVAGGNKQNNQALNSAEIFDPATGTFSPTGDMTAFRYGPAAAPLPDGRVLVAGGDTGPNPASAEIFDPRTGTFSPTGSMTLPRDGAAAAPLPNGRAVVLGGVYPPAARAEIFDAATGKFAPAGENTFTGGYHVAAAPLPDGRVLVVFGSGSFGAGQVFDPVTDAFVATDYMTTRRYGAAVAPLPDGRVLVAGTVVGFGPDALALTRSAELFTPALSYRLDGRRLSVRVAMAGTLTVSNAKSRRAASSRVGKSHPALKPARRKGEPPRSISVKLTPTDKARGTLERTGKLTVRARLRFVPKPVKGDCVTGYSPCRTSDYAINQTVRLTLKAKRR